MPGRGENQSQYPRQGGSAAAFGAADERAVGTCPRCGRDAPIVYRGVVPSCTACGAARVPLSSPSVNLAGKPARVGGAFATFFGILVLVLGETFALGVGLLAFALTTPGVALGLSLPIALASLIFGVLLLGGGRRLGRAGREAEAGVRGQALLALAAERGAITAADGARLLRTSVRDADALLTAFAKREPDRLAVDVDDQGIVWFRPVGVRIGGVRIGGDGGSSSTRSERHGGAVLVDVDERDEREAAFSADESLEGDAARVAKGRE